MDALISKDPTLSISHQAKRPLQVVKTTSWGFDVEFCLQHCDEGTLQRVVPTDEIQSGLMVRTIAFEHKRPCRIITIEVSAARHITIIVVALNLPITASGAVAMKDVPAFELGSLRVTGIPFGEIRADHFLSRLNGLRSSFCHIEYFQSVSRAHLSFRARTFIRLRIVNGNDIGLMIDWGASLAPKCKRFAPTRT
jgi:hypothetical protein